LSNLQEAWFTNLSNLEWLNIAWNGISQLPENVFRPLTRLTHLFIYGNAFTQLTPNMFTNVPGITYLDMSSSQIEEIQDRALVGLPNLSFLSFGYSRIRSIAPNAFEGLNGLTYLHLYNNSLQELPAGVFSHFNVKYLGLRNNRLKTVRRHWFNEVSNLTTFDLSGNLINAVELSLVQEAMGLQTMNFINNLCTSGQFLSFVVNREQHMERLNRCFTNFRFIVGKNQMIIF
jgi:Leucine-rich repeat (LRR) protein